MTTCGPVTKSLLLLAVVVALSGQGSAARWKPIECCTRVSRKEITDTITDYLVQKRNNHCVNAIIFLTESSDLYCSKHDEPWVMKKVRQLRAQKRAALASSPSLLKPITSTSSPPSTAPPSHSPSSSPPSPSSPTSLLKLITSSSSPPPLEGTTGTPSTHYTVQ